jgi:transcription elongation GreA/GreB family factor
MFSFLLEDYQALQTSINKLKKQMSEIGKEMGESCREGAETFHDNFVHEEGSRQLKMLSQRYRELINIKENSVIVTVTADNTHVSIGKNVSLHNLLDNTVTNFKIGSYMVLSESEAISYFCPLAKIILGAKVGEKREGMIGKTNVKYQILEIF